MSISEPKNELEIKQRLQALQAQVVDACHLANRSLSEIKVLAVSKTKPLSLISQFADLGLRAFGENYVQEAVEKQSLRPDLDWHFIGSLQTNKVKQVVGKFSLLHSVDRLKLLMEIQKQAAVQNQVQDILFQVHIGDEETKSGASEAELEELFLHAQDCSAISVRGLMCLPPLAPTQEVSRSYFRQLKEIFDLHSAKLAAVDRQRFSILSMGTSGDFQAAILEGATHIRVGSNLFGSRNNA